MSHPSPVAVRFARGVVARLALWPALKLAVHHSWGGPESAQKQRWLAGVIVDQFEEFLPSSSSSVLTPGGSGTAASPPDAAYIEEMLLQIMSDEFEVSLEDDSALAVANDVVKLWKDVCDGSETVVIEMEAQAEKLKSRVPQYEVGTGSGSDWEDDEEESESDDAEGGEGEEVVPQLVDRSRDRQRAEPEVDEDGFTIVKKKGRR
ncbi:Pre-rRNA-processing protein TSR2-domain-containing protein [Phlebopus sp. FC_14]|nr:Pre-rRNA-processing protein TSR2-domain-containing protein [Phlebopus sp. FC_14]